MADLFSRLVRHDDRSGRGEHAADAVADEMLAPGLGGAVPRIWRTLSWKAYMPYIPECMWERPPAVGLSGSLGGRSCGPSRLGVHTLAGR